MDYRGLEYLTSKDLPPLPPIALDCTERQGKSSDLVAVGKVQRYRPNGIGSVALGSFIAASLGLIVALQLLTLAQRKNGAVLVASSVDDFPIWSKIAYLYLPVVIVTMYGIAWTWVEITVKRMEPYYQMSRPSGACAKGSILLDYSTDFLAFLPLKALKMRHMTVFVAGLVMLTAAWGLTPLAGAILRAETKTFVRPITSSALGNLLAIEDQTSKLNAGIFNAAYAYIWLNASLPGFIDEDQALLPIHILGSKEVPSSSALLSGLTTAFTSDLVCTPPRPTSGLGCERSIPAPWSSDGLWVSNGKGCTVPRPSPSTGGSRSYLSYHGWAGSAQSSGINGGCCPEASSNTFFAIYYPEVHTTVEPLMLFCETSYWSQPVNATVRTKDSFIVSVQASGPKQELHPPTFNTSWFDTQLSIAVTAFSEFDTLYDGSWGTMNADLDDAIIYDQSQRLSLLRPKVVFGHDISRYAMALDRSPLVDFSDPKKLTAALRRTHSLLFSLAINAVTSTRVDAQSTTPNTRAQTRDGFGAITISSPFIIASQCLILAILLAAIWMLYAYHKRPLALDGDPSTTANVIGLSSQSLEGLLERLPAEAFPQDHKHVLEDYRYKITSRQARGGKAIAVNTSLKTLDQHDHSSSKPTNSEQHVRPIELRTGALLLFMACIVSIICGLSILRLYIGDTGLRLPTDASFANQLILNYIPTTLGALMEALWVVINRSLCYLTPWERLRKGSSSKSSCFNASYTTLPPQLVLFSALRNLEWLLVMVCITALIANVVSVGLSGLFIIKPSFDRAATTLTAQFATGLSPTPKDDRNSFFDYLYSAGHSFRSDASLPPWASQEAYILPLMPGASKSAAELEYQTITDGLSLDPGCSANDALVEETKDGLRIHTTAVAPWAASTIYCSVEFGIDKDNLYAPLLDRKAPLGYLGAELISVSGNVISWNSQDLNATRGNCTGILVTGWARAGARSIEGVELPTSANLSKPTATVITCRPQVQVNTYNVTFGRDGTIRRASKDRHLYTSVQSEQYISLLLNTFSGSHGSVGLWHDRPFVSDWFNYLIKTATSHKAVDPRLPPPVGEDMARTADDVLRRLFVIMLSMNPEWLVPATAANTRGATIRTPEERVFFAPYIFEILVALMGLNLVVAIALLLARPGKFLPAMPTSIGAILALVNGSSVVEDAKHEGSADAAQHERGTQLAYGKYIDIRGHPRVGVERRPYCRPIEYRNGLQRVFDRFTAQ